MKKAIIWAGLVAGALAFTASPSQAQSALAIVKKLEALEARMNELEHDPAPAQTVPAFDPSNLQGALAQIREQIDGLEAEIESIKSDVDVAADVNTRLDAITQDLSDAAGSMENHSNGQPATESSSPIQDDLKDLLAELKAYVEHAREIEAEAAKSPLTLTGRVHTQFSTTSSQQDVVASDFLIRRARLTAVLKINDLVTGKIQPDFGKGKITLKDAYVRFGFDRGFRLTVGQFKRPFDLFTLTSSTKILTIETQGVVRGVDTCAGPGGVCSYNRFTEKLGYSDRDIGAMFDGKLGNGDWSYMVSVTNGEGANKSEKNDTKSYGGRLQYSVSGNLKLAGNVAVHDYDNSVDADQTHATAYGADIEWGSYSRGWHGQAGVVRGQNWKNVLETGDPSTFRALQGILTFKHPITSTARVAAVEPLLRVSWADPNSELTEDHEVFVTGGFVVHFVGRNKIAFNVDRWMPAVGDGEWSLKIQSYLHF